MHTKLPFTKSELSKTDGVDIGWQELFEFKDSSVLDILLDNFHKLKDTLCPPIKLGHDEKQSITQNSGYPSAGWITDLMRKDGTNKLLAFFSKVPPLVAKLIEAKKYRKLSPEIYHNFIDPDTKKQYGPTFRGVAIEGADIPEIKTLADLTVVYHSDNLPFSIPTKEDSMDPIAKLNETIKSLKTEILQLTKKDKKLDITKLTENFNKNIKELESEALILAKSKNKKDNNKDDQDAVRLSEVVKNQESTITKLSETVKKLGSELKGANSHILESKKAEYKASKSKLFSPAFIEKSLEYLNFSENDQILNFIDDIIKLHESKSLFAPESLNINEDIVNPTLSTNSLDDLHNNILALSEKEKIPYDEAFDRVLALSQLK